MKEALASMTAGRPVHRLADDGVSRPDWAATVTVAGPGRAPGGPRVTEPE